MHFLQTIHHYRIPKTKHPGLSPKVSIVLAHTTLAPDLAAFLDKMINAFEWDNEACFHLDIATEVLDYSTVWSGKNLKLIVCFGITARSLGLFVSESPYSLLKIAPFVLYQCDTLDKIAGRKELKSKLWQDLKPFKTPTLI